MAGDFETIADIYRYLLDGGKVTYHTWDQPNWWLHMSESGALVSEVGSVRDVSFMYPDLWSKYVEPPKSFDNMGDALAWMLEDPVTRRVRDSRGTDWFWKDGVLYTQYQRRGFHDSSPRIAISTFTDTFTEVK